VKLEMAENSLFAILMRGPWWVSAAIAAALIALSFWALPPAYAAFGAAGAAPFVVIAAIAGWRQLKAPSARRVAQTADAARAMSWPAFSGAVEDAFRREGYEVSRVGGPAADFNLKKGYRISLVSCKRWKAARTGVEPLRELHAAKEACDAHECIYVATGEITDNARKFAADKSIRLVHGPALVQLLAAGGHRKSAG
jgi:restriction system protein